MNKGIVIFYVILLIYMSYRKLVIRNEFLMTPKLIKKIKISKSIKDTFSNSLKKNFKIGSTSFVVLDMAATVLFNILTPYIIFNGLYLLIDTIIYALLVNGYTDVNTSKLIEMYAADTQLINKNIAEGKQTETIDYLKNIKVNNYEYYKYLIKNLFILFNENAAVASLNNLLKFVKTEYYSIKTLRAAGKGGDILQGYIVSKDGNSLNNAINISSDKNIISIIKNLEIAEYTKKSGNLSSVDAQIFDKMYDNYAKVCRVNLSQCRKLSLNYYPDRNPNLPNAKEKFIAFDALYKMMTDLYK